MYNLKFIPLALFLFILFSTLNIKALNFGVCHDFEAIIEVEDISKVEKQDDSDWYDSAYIPFADYSHKTSGPKHRRVKVKFKYKYRTLNDWEKYVQNNYSEVFYTCTFKKMYIYCPEGLEVFVNDISFDSNGVPVNDFPLQMDDDGNCFVTPNKTYYMWATEKFDGSQFLGLTVHGYCCIDDEGFKCYCDNYDSLGLLSYSCSACQGLCVRTKLDSVNMEINLGTAFHGEPLGSLFLYHKGKPDASLAKLSSLSGHVAPAADKFYENGVIKQIYCEKYLLNFEEVNDCKYIIQMYDAPDYDENRTTPYPVSGSPFKTITIENPVASGNIIVNQLKITESGSIDYINLFNWNEDNNGWELYKGKEGDATIEYILNKYVDGIRVETIETKDNDGNIIYREENRYKTFKGKEKIIESIVDPGGENLTTTYTYNTDELYFFHYQKLYATLQSVTYPDGSWVRYEYDTTSARIIKTITPFNNSKINDPDNLSHVDKVEYIDEFTTAYIQIVAGNEVSRRFRINKPGESKKEIIATSPGAPINDPNNIVTYTEYYPLGQLYGGTIKSILSPDGTMTIYSYHDDPNTENRITEITSGVPDADKENIIDGSKVVAVSDDTGTILSAESFDIISGQKISSAIYSDFDPVGRARRIDYMDGSHVEKTFGCCGVEQEVSKQGVVTEYQYDSLKRLEAKTVDGIKTSYTYDAKGNQIAVEIQPADPNLPPQITQYSYNLAGKMILTIDPENLITRYFEDGLVSVTTFQNDAKSITTRNLDGSTASASGDAVHGTSFEYGIENGELFTKSYPTAFPEQWTKSYTDFLGRNYKTLYSDGSFAIIYYDNAGHPVKQIAPNGLVTLSEYNAKGELFKSGTDLNDNGILDADDRYSEYANSIVQAHGTYVKQSIVKVNENGTMLETSRSETSLDGIQLWNTSFGRTTHTQTSYDDNGQVTTVTTTPEGETITTISQNGRTVSTTHSTLGTTTYSYNPYHQLESVTKIVNGQSQTISYTYDLNGNMLSITDPDGNTTNYLYSGMNQKYLVTLPDGSTIYYYYVSTGEVNLINGSGQYPVYYTFDEAGRMTEMSTWRKFGPDGTFDTTKWEYNSKRGFMTKKIYPDGSSVSYSYDSAGNILARTWARNDAGNTPVVTSYSYDTAGTLVNVDYSDSTPDIHYSYDTLGRKIEISDATGTKTIAYNDNSTVDSETIPYIVDNTVNYQYDALGRRINLNIKNQQIDILNFDYDYDNAGRIQSLAADNINVSLNRLPNSNLVASTVYNDGTDDFMTVSNSYDILNRVVSINADAQAFNRSFAYEYDSLGKRLKTTFENGSYWKYEYDDHGQVVSAKKYADDNTPLGKDYTFQFDDIGNRANASYKNDNGSTVDVSYTNNELNQYTTISSTDTTFSPSYDEDGNMTQCNLGVPPESWNFTYNAENRLIAMETETGSTTGPQLGYRLEFNYDYLGRRVEKKIFTKTNGTLSYLNSFRYIYDGFKCVARYASNDDSTYQLDRKYLWNGEELLIVFQDNSMTPYFPITDANKNITDYIDKDGNLAAHFEYSPFGKIIDEDGAISDDFEFRFSSEVYDSKSGLVYYNYRYYSPELGRWLSRDPIEEKGGYNLYAMVANDPVNKWDALGMIEWLNNGYCCTNKSTMLDEVAKVFGIKKSWLIYVNKKKGIILNGNKTEGKKIWVVMFTNDVDWKLLARISYAEGTANNSNDKYAIPSVVLLRTKFVPRGTYPTTVRGVIYQKNAFEAVLKNSRKWQASLNPETLLTKADVKEWNMSAKGAIDALTYGPLKSLQGATVFHSNKNFPNSPIPRQVATKYWNWEKTIQIGGHYYFKITPK